jgi:hypothetical protein
MAGKQSARKPDKRVGWTMNTNPLTKGVLVENFAGIGTVTPEMVEQRAVELALINGRPATDVSQTDLEQAQRELTGEPELDPTDAASELVPESERWDPLPGSNGHQVAKSIEDDEDGEGRSIGEQLVAEGVSEAEHDQMLQAARSAEKKDPTEKTDR